MKYFRFLKIVNSADPGEMLPHVAFHLGLHCLPNNLLTSIQNEMGKRASYLFVWQDKSYGIEHYSPSRQKGAQWLSGRVLDSRPKDRGFQPHWRHCVVVLEQDTFILA